MSSSSAARAKEPRSATRTNTRIASSWSIRLLFRRSEFRRTITPVYRSSQYGYRQLRLLPEKMDERPHDPSCVATRGRSCDLGACGHGLAPACGFARTGVPLTLAAAGGNSVSSPRARTVKDPKGPGVQALHVKAVVVLRDAARLRKAGRRIL